MSRLKKHPLITGTIILTLTGLISRLIGFFYRIYLSRLFGEEGMGIYQLLGPVLALSFSLTAAGFQTAISKFVASETSTKDVRHSLRVLLTGLTFSLALSLPCTFLLIRFSEQVAVSFLLEPRTTSMLRIVALSIPLASVHACINGYFYGIKQTALPATTQLVEQIFRVGSVALITAWGTRLGREPVINTAVLGLVVGEGISMLLSVLAALGSFSRKLPTAPHPPAAVGLTGRLLALAIPLALNRIAINFLQSVEAIYIPNKLLAYGYDHATALSVYGVLTGMALPLILFPNALTNSVAVLLLPVISEADSMGNQALIRKAIQKTIRYSSMLGAFCMAFFFLTGKALGCLLFQSPLAGHFIMTLSFICPFLYLSATLSSVINGLGKAGVVFFTNVTALLLRLFFVFFLLPHVGIKGYLWALLASQCYTALLYIFYLRFHSRHLMHK